MRAYESGDRSILATLDVSTRRSNIPRHTGISGTLSLTETSVSADAAGGVQFTGARARVHGDRLADDEAIGDELADGLARVGVGDLVDFVRVQPDLALAAVSDGGRQALLSAKIDPGEDILLASMMIRHTESQSMTRTHANRFRTASKLRRVPPAE